MKQSDIDRWMRRQSRQDNRKKTPGLNLVGIVALLAMAVASLYVLLMLMHMS